MDVNGAEVTSSDPADAENTSEGFKTRLKSLLLTRSETLRSRFEDENFMNDFVRSLMDGTVFAITKELKDIQCISEHDLYEKRMKFIEDQTETKQKILKKHRDELQSAAPDALANVRKRHAREIKDLNTKSGRKSRANDMRIAMDLDLLVNQQQVTLEKAGVPGFFITNKAPELELQMDLLCLIEELHS